MMQRRTLLKHAVATLAAGQIGGVAHAASAGAGLHERTARAAAKLAAGSPISLTLMYPAGCLSNLKPLVREFSDRTGIKITLTEVPLDQINDEILIEAEARSGAFDVALPATFGLPDLVEAGALVNLDRYASKYEPKHMQRQSLYSIGDYYKGSLYGYQTDGDAYLMFYRKSWLEDQDNQKRFADRYGYPLAVPETWEQLDQMMAFFHEPTKSRFGGCLYRTEFFVAWEWWIRFHAKGLYPLADDLTPRIASPEGIAALEEMVLATRHQDPGVFQYGLFENFEAFSRGHTFCNIGWGGTQKYIHSNAPELSRDLAFAPTPGGFVDGQLLRTPYFNWGWNYVVSNTSAYPEIAYLFTLFASSPQMSLTSVRQAGGYFDPFRTEHYADPEVREIYSPEFLAAHEDSMRHSIPDFYVKGYVEYFDELRLNLHAAVAGDKSPKRALRETAEAWGLISDRMGRRSQRVQWAFLKSSYPDSVRKRLE